MNITPYMFAVACFCSFPVWAQDMVYDDRPTLICLEDAGREDGSAAVRLACAGTAADVCMSDNEDGYTTLGMGYCFDREWQFWDAALNTAYGKLMGLYRLRDAEVVANGWDMELQVDALQAMQRAWITYRDARCDFERAKWDGGTGGAPATIQCLMAVTAAQTILLQDGMGEDL